MSSNSVNSHLTALELNNSSPQPDDQTAPTTVQSAIGSVTGHTRSIQLLYLLNPSNKFKYHDLLQSDYMTDHASEIIFCTELSVKVLSWNLDQLSPSKNPFILSTLEISERKLADIYVFNFQETISLKSFSTSSQQISTWANYILSLLPTDYSLIHKSGLLGLTTILISKKSLESQISNVNVETVGLGYLRWYNKGCISLTFTIGQVDSLKLPGIKLQFFNLHLVHGEGDSVALQRYNSLQKIQTSIGIIDSNATLTDSSKPSQLPETSFYPISLSEIELYKLASSLSNLDLSEMAKLPKQPTSVVLAGDTNYRITDNISLKEINDLVRSRSFSKLLSNDQLRISYRSGKIFINFKEGEIDFAPTFKVNSNGSYDSKRKPAYTDRIFYTPNPELTQTEYASLTIPGSDHFPVISVFSLTTPVINETVLKKYRMEFSNIWDECINKIEFLQIEKGIIDLDTVVGDNVEVQVAVSSVCDETVRFKVEDSNRKLFNRGGFRINYKNMNTRDSKDQDTSIYKDINFMDNGLVNKGWCIITPRSKVLVKFNITPYVYGIIDKNFIISVEGFQWVKFIGIRLNVKDIFGISVNDLEERRFDNIIQCFEFIRTGGPGRLLARIETLDSLQDLNDSERRLIKEVTLETVDWEKYREINSQNKNGGSVATMAIVYIWLKCQSANFGINTQREKMVFAEVIRLIKFFRMDASKGYTTFGWLFDDEYELNDYLESDHIFDESNLNNQNI